MSIQLQLFKNYPALEQQIPWVPLMDCSPTPVQKLAGLQADHGLDDIFIKRDDLTSTLFAGNKVRKNEFLLADALNKKADHLVTMGAIGSHHCCSVAAFGKKLGLPSTLIQTPQPVTPHVLEMLRWDLLYEPEFVLARNEVAQILAIRKELKKLKKEGKNPYFIWAGGSTAVGTLGYINAGLELFNQIEQGLAPLPEVIFVPLGSCSTYAGLLAARAISQMDTKIIGVRVVPWPVTSRATVRHLANAALSRLEAILENTTFSRVSFLDIQIDGRYIGSGYGHETNKAVSALELLRSSDAIELEPTYTSKTFAALLDYANSNPGHGPLLFLNTFNGVPLPDFPSYTQLPVEYHRFFEAQS